MRSNGFSVLLVIVGVAIAGTLLFRIGFRSQSVDRKAVTVPQPSSSVSKQIIPTSLPNKIVDTLSPTPSKSTAWNTYQNEYGYVLEYPENWQLLEVNSETECQDSEKLVCVALDEEEGEFHKIVISGTEYEQWQGGELKITLLANPDKLEITEWVNDYEVTSATGASLIQKVEDVLLGNRLAKRLTIYAFDHDEIMIVASFNNFIINIQHEGNSPNAPSYEEHHQVYDKIVRSFRYSD